MALSDGMSRAEVDRIEAKDFALGIGPLRPRNAATLILLDGHGSTARILLGRRHRGHAFMPGKFVFPGGRTDLSDGRVAVAAPLHPQEESRIAGSGYRATSALAQAVALSAIREAYEEAGMLLGRAEVFQTAITAWRDFAAQGVKPALDRLRFVGRAITPPGRVRRFDTRFLAAFRHDVVVELPGGGPSGELEELVWLPIDEAKRADVPAITLTMLDELQRRLADDPELKPGVPAPIYRMHRSRFVRHLV
ncbi:NUDIX hydrolase [Acidiphilium cryptum]|uniref:NUDIX hydrolase n=1 Tax=Acidiphilium cryptum (strain JF-5) TaxID=349163 RepID=A5FTM8_ACICJ|nr:NUDIX hydrolase [Acidiphilium cryptum]ABQ28960.1 NUDIX hydrolase [Acidiphilium cryptum JF-5]